MDGLLWGGAGHSQCGNGLHGAFGGKHPARQYRYDERMFAEYSAGSVFYPALGAGYGGGRSRARYVPVQLCCMYVFFHTFIYKTKKHLCMHSSEDVPVKERNHCWRMRGGDSRRDPETAPKQTVHFKYSPVAANVSTSVPSSASSGFLPTVQRMENTRLQNTVQ